MWRHLSPNKQGMLLALAAGMAYFVAYRLNELMDSWALYAQGINLIFIPAGIKHLAILLAGKWGALGSLVALFVLAIDFWKGASVEQIACYSLFSTAATWIGILLSLRLFGICRDLSNLKLIHLPVMDLITTALHGAMTNAYFFLTGMKSENFVANALAMMVGDYVGSFIVLMLLWAGLMAVKRCRLQQQP